MMPLVARLKWIENESCLVLVTTKYPPVRTAVPLWPKGTTPLRAPDGRRGIITPEGEQILDGDTFSGGGSWVTKTQPSYSLVRPPAGCGKHEGFFTIDRSDIERAEH
ncbi:hypothetical protein Misp02_56730 [Microtetraspora sp. NBRC 16547]|nr:hypothetical protein Misp02_56730 [Microtetraspora sp. NBRC 16547]